MPIASGGIVSAPASQTHPSPAKITAAANSPQAQQKTPQRLSPSQAVNAANKPQTVVQEANAQKNQLFSAGGVNITA